MAARNRAAKPANRVDAHKGHPSPRAPPKDPNHHESKPKEKRVAYPQPDVTYNAIHVVDQWWCAIIAGRSVVDACRLRVGLVLTRFASICAKEY
jgi:hypothetical protein